MNDSLIICGVGSGMSNSLKDIKNLGVKITVITDVVDENVLKYADKVIECYPRSLEEVMKKIEDENIVTGIGIMTLGYENVPVIAKVAEKLNIESMDLQTALNCTHKNLRTPLLNKGGVRVPKHKIAVGLEDAIEACEYIGYPVVVKPNDKTSSMGVSKIEKKQDSTKLIKEALSYSASNTVIIEEFLIGTEHTVEGIVTNGEVIVTGISDRNYSEKEKYHPYFFENGDTLPSQLTEVVIQNMLQIVESGIKILKLNNTGFHCDILISKDNEIIILEIAGRIAGSRFGTEIVPLATGVNLLPNVARLALGWEIKRDELIKKFNKAVVLRYLIAPQGRILEFGGLEDAKSSEGVYDAIWEMELKEGLYIKSYSSGKDMLASVIAIGNNIEDAEENAQRALEKIYVKLEEENNE